MKKMIIIGSCMKRLLIIEKKTQTDGVTVCACNKANTKTNIARQLRVHREELKGLVHPKMKMLSVFTHPYVVLTP